MRICKMEEELIDEDEQLFKMGEHLAGSWKLGEQLVGEDEQM
jgi:hypothetical protein